MGIRLFYLFEEHLGKHRWNHLRGGSQDCVACDGFEVLGEAEMLVESDELFYLQVLLTGGTAGSEIHRNAEQMSLILFVAKLIESRY